MSDLPDFNEFLNERGVILTDIHVCLTKKDNGWNHSNCYIRKDVAGKIYPDANVIFAGLAQPFMGTGVEVIAGPATGAIPFVHGVANYISALEDRKVIAVYTEPESYADGAPSVLKRGYDIDVKGMLVGFVEDILTTGRSAKLGIEAVFAAEPRQIIGISVIANRGGVTPANLWGIPLDALVNYEFQNWHEDECPLCKTNVPLLTTIGKGTDWLETEKGRIWIAQGGSIAKAA